MKLRTYRVEIAAMALIAPWMANAAQAQDAAPAEEAAPADDAASQGLGEIIVTAQKRAESAQDVPIALSVFDAAALEDANIDRIEEIVLRTPNFTMMRVNVGEPQFYIRGVGSNSDSAAGDPTGSWHNRPQDFRRIGEAVGALLPPILVVQEGGYRTGTLGANARQFFEGLWISKRPSP